MFRLSLYTDWGTSVLKRLTHHEASSFETLLGTIHSDVGFRDFSQTLK
jgi:hypothetical protein